MMNRKKLVSYVNIKKKIVKIKKVAKVVIGNEKSGKFKFQEIKNYLNDK